jgi:hypothetical protein
MFGWDFRAKTPLPAGAHTQLTSGPLIASPHPETIPTLPPNAAALMAAAPPDRCLRPGCSGKLAPRKGILKVPGMGGVLVVEDSARCKRQVYVACQKCGTPVPVDHPRQKEVDSQCEAAELKERQEAERASRQAAASPPKAAPINQALSLPDAVNSAHDLIMRLRADLERLTHRLAALEKARKTPAEGG